MAIRVVASIVQAALAIPVIALCMSGAVLAEDSGTSTAISPAAEAQTPRNIVDIAVDRSGSIYLLDHARDEVVKCDKDGKVEWQARLTSPDGKKSGAWHIFPVDIPGSSLVIPSYTGFWKLSQDGKLSALCSSKWQYTDRVPAMDMAGRFYFPDRENKRVGVYVHQSCPENLEIEPSPYDQMFPRGCNWKMELTIEGDVPEPARFGDVYNVVTDPHGKRIWVLDHSYTYNVFDGSGTFLMEVKAPDEKNRSFTYVQGIAFDDKGDAFVGCGETKNILNYDSKGKLVATIPLPKDSVRGSWGEGMAMGPDGNLYCGGSKIISGKPSIFVVNVLNTSGELQRTIELSED